MGAPILLVSSGNRNSIDDSDSVELDEIRVSFIYV